MAESPMVGARIKAHWQEQIREIAAATGQTEAQIIRSAIAQYLNQNDPSAVKGAITDLQERVINLERKLGRLAG